MDSVTAYFEGEPFELTEDDTEGYFPALVEYIAEKTYYSDGYTPENWKWEGSKATAYRNNAIRHMKFHDDWVKQEFDNLSKD